jgi:hypothetical protein
MFLVEKKISLILEYSGKWRKEQYSVFYTGKNNNEMFPTSSKYFIINKRKFKYVFYNTKCCIYEYMFFSF